MTIGHILAILKARWFSALLMFAMHVKKGSYENLPYLIGICCVCALLPLLLLNHLLPLGQKPAAAAAASSTATPAAVAHPPTRVNDEHDRANDPLHEGADSAAHSLNRPPIKRESGNLEPAGNSEPRHRSHPPPCDGQVLTGIL